MKRASISVLPCWLAPPSECGTQCKGVSLSFVCADALSPSSGCEVKGFAGYGWNTGGRSGILIKNFTEEVRGKYVCNVSM